MAREVLTVLQFILLPLTHEKLSHTVPPAPLIAILPLLQSNHVAESAGEAAAR